MRLCKRGACPLEYRFEASEQKSTGVVHLSGRLDLLAAAELKAEVQRLVGEGWSQLVVDLSGVPYADSSGLGALVGSLRAARSAGGDFRIARPAEQIRYILKVST